MVRKFKYTHTQTFFAHVIIYNHIICFKKYDKNYDSEIYAQIFLSYIWNAHVEELNVLKSINKLL